MRFLFINNHCITDPTVGVTRSMWTMLRWLAEAGHEVSALTTARFESPQLFSIEKHLEKLNVRLHWDHERKSQRRGKRCGNPNQRRVVRFRLDGVSVTMLVTRSHDEFVPDASELAQYLKLFDRQLTESPPDQVIAASAHPMICEALAAARKQSITTVFTIRSYGYELPEFFRNIDHVFTTSAFMTRYFQQTTGLSSTPIDSPMDWSEILAPTDSRKFVTFVNPSPHKGAMFFAALAQMLGESRPDIPILVVQSGRTAELLNSIPGVDFTRYPQMMAAPPTAKPSEFFALTRILLVPSAWEEPFGRVAAEAMINGIPAIVSDRGGLPETVGGDFADGGAGLVRPLPTGFTQFTTELPSDAAVRPWFDAVCQLWDDNSFYDEVSRRARQLAAEQYSEAALRRKYVEYFTTLPKFDHSLPEREISGFI